jgi:predicted SprT family Zn-dependent metalloprotease
VEKIERIFKECKNELNSIGIDFGTDCIVDIKVSKRNNKRYGCCRPEEPDLKTKYYSYVRGRRYVKFKRYKKYHIEISPWVLELNEDIIKNTVIHEMIHCMPECDNHGEIFKYYANIVNTKLGYNISRVGNKTVDYENSNKENIEEIVYNYKIVCQKCGQVFYRMRLGKGFTRKYYCGKCKGKFVVQSGKFIFTNNSQNKHSEKTIYL